jgi:hypothetical protein
MRILRKDFVPVGTASYCNNRLLTSCKAYILEDVDRGQFYAGLICIKKHFPDVDIDNIPDLTKALIPNIEPPIDKNPNRFTSQTTKSKNTSLTTAISYLLFREECLSKHMLIKKYKFNKLTKLYDTYIRNGTLSDIEIKEVLTCEIKSRDLNKQLSFKNLSIIYAFEFILKSTLIHVKNNDFIKSLLQFLRNNGYLTSPQIKGLSKYLDRIPEMKNSKLKEFE